MQSLLRIAYIAIEPGHLVEEVEGMVVWIARKVGDGPPIVAPNPQPGVGIFDFPQVDRRTHSEEVIWQ